VRAKLLYEIPSKIESCKDLLKILAGRTLIFGNSINSLNEITTNCISSKNTSDKNDEILNRFQSGKIDVLASFKMLEQGANLKGLNNIILHSYYGREKSFIQRLGRGRLDVSKPINLIVFLTKETQEEIWFKNMIGDFNTELIWCDNINQFKQKYYEIN
jgi:superfamily II DNA or RNA helicase